MPLLTLLEPCIQKIQQSWRTVVLSLRGERHDYTAVPLNRAVLLLAVPMIFEMFVASLSAVISIFWVARLGSEAIAVVGLTESVMQLIAAVAIGLSAAARAIVARRVGERDSDQAARVAGQIIVLGIAISAGMGLVLGYFSADILRLMGATESTVILGTGFARLMLAFNATVVLIFLINAIFRGAGDAVLAMRTLWLVIALTIVLEPCFIFGWGPFPELGVTGAAVATIIGRGTGVLYQVWLLAGGHGRLQVRLRHLKLVVDDVKTIVTMGSNAMVQSLATTASLIGLMKLLASFGNSALAGYTIATRITAFALLPVFGLASAGATLVAQNLGAGKPARAEEAIRIARRFDVIFIAVVGALFVVMAQSIVSSFTSDPAVLEFGTRALWILSLALPLQAAGLCHAAAFNGAGDTRTPARLILFCLAGQFPLAWILTHVLNFGPTGIFIAVPLSFSAFTLWSGVLFRKGLWKHYKI